MSRHDSQKCLQKPHHQKEKENIKQKPGPPFPPENRYCKNKYANHLNALCCHHIFNSSPHVRYANARSISSAAQE